MNRHTLQQHTLSPHSSPAPGSLSLTMELHPWSLMWDWNNVSNFIGTLAQHKDGTEVSDPGHHQSTLQEFTEAPEASVIKDQGFPASCSLAIALHYQHNGKVTEHRFQTACCHFNTLQLLQSRHNANLTI